MRKERAHYSREFKIKAVELSNERNSLISVAEELHIKKQLYQFLSTSKLGIIKTEDIKT